MIARQIPEVLPSLRSFARRLTRDGEDAKDLVQETVARAIQAEKSFDGKNIRAWMFTIMKNCHLSARKRASLWKGMEASLADRSAGVWAAVSPAGPESGPEGREVRLAMARLHPRKQELLQRLAEGRSYKEIAAEDGVPIGTVMSRVHRARSGFARVS